MIKAGIIGATGYAGGELARLLLQREDVEILWYGSRSYVGQKYASVYPNLFQIVEDSCQDDSLKELAERADVVFMDPPRAGSTPEFLDAVSRMNPEKLVYISCNPETQQRDLEYLRKRGWEVKMIQPVDMFPHTDHVETVVRLQRKDI